ncbi:unnamed protein product [Urochloa humidicola]
MSKAGWRDVQQRYYAATGLLHDSEQFSSRLRQLRAMWLFIQKCRDDTGLGKNPDGTVDADEEWWEEKTEGKPEWKKLKSGWPIFLDEMEQMFRGVAVDGYSSFGPGQQMRRNCFSSSEDEEYDDDEQLTPSSLGSKRQSSGRSTRSTCSSPNKKLRTPAVHAVANRMNECNLIQENRNEMMQSFISQRQREKAEQAAAKQRKVELVQKLARECGASETSGNLWVGVLAVCNNETSMDFFIRSEPAGRLTIIQGYTFAITGVNN